MRSKNRWQRIFLYGVIFLLTLWGATPAEAQFTDDIPETVLTFNPVLEPVDPRPGEHARLVMQLDVLPGWHIYSIVPAEGEFPPIPTTMKLALNELQLVGPLFETNPITAPDQVLDQVLSFHELQAALFQNLLVPASIEAGKGYLLNGTIRYQACSDRVCLPPKTEPWQLSYTLGAGPVRAQYSTPQYAVDLLREEGSELEVALQKGLWGFLALAAMAGLLALLTPCVFPMIPVTVAFFSKQESAGNGDTLRLSLLFGLGIVGTYTVTGMGLSAALGASGAIKVATNGWVNLAIGMMFTLFAFSLMGFFQLQLPAGMGNTADQLSRRLSGPTGVLAMGLAFTLTSFTCTVQFVGTLMIAASQGLWFWPIVGMLVFSTVFAFPFFLLGMFPRLISTMHSSSGAWMEHLKIVLGLLELAAAFKFFSNTDLVWQWGVIDRDFVLTAWAVLCVVGAFFLLGSVTIHHTRISQTGGLGFSVALAFLMLGLYFSRGLGNIPLNPWVDTYLPPPLEQEQKTSVDLAGGSVVPAHNLPWETNLDSALALARKDGKRVFIDFTGYTCVNCRWMEKNVFSDPEVMALFRRDFILVQLYTDGGENAEANQQLQIERFRTVALPLYIVLNAENRMLARHAGILEPADRFLQFLKLQRQG